MRTKKLGAVLTSLTITLGAAAVLATGPAQAAGTVATTAKLTMNQQTTVKGQYGDAVGYLEATVADPLGGLVYTGSAVLQRYRKQVGLR